MLLTKRELRDIEWRVDEILALIDRCDETIDADILIELHDELEQIEQRLEVSIDMAVKNERHLKLVP